MPSADEAWTLEQGWPVITQDNETIGRAVEVRGDLFRVAAPLRPDFWLSRSRVVAAAPEGVAVSFAKEQLDAERTVPAPPDLRIDTPAHKQLLYEPGLSLPGEERILETEHRQDRLREDV